MRKIVLIAFVVMAYLVNATTVVNVNNIYYILDESAHTAQVTCRPFEDDIEDGWMYYETSELYVGAVSVPETFSYNDVTYTVVALAPSAFAGSKLLTSLSLPKTVTTCGNGAFSACNGLASVTVADENPVFTTIDGVVYTRSPLAIYLVPRALTGEVSIHDDITEIPSSAFQYCAQLDSVNIPAGVTTIKDGAFDHCTALSEVHFDFNARLKTIERNAFSNCTSIEILFLPENVETIGANAFDGCSNLQWITLGNKLQSIGRYAFYNCNLKEITLPATLTTINDYAFQGCANLDKIYNQSNLKLEMGSTTNGYVAYYASHIIEQQPASLTDQTQQNAFYCHNGRVVTNGDLRIYTLSGIDVTQQNGYLDGIYIVQVDNKTYKVKVRKE